MISAPDSPHAVVQIANALLAELPPGGYAPTEFDVEDPGMRDALRSVAGLARAVVALSAERDQLRARLDLVFADLRSRLAPRATGTERGGLLKDLTVLGILDACEAASSLSPKVPHG